MALDVVFSLLLFPCRISHFLQQLFLICHFQDFGRLALCFEYTLFRSMNVYISAAQCEFLFEETLSYKKLTENMQEDKYVLKAEC